MTVELDALIEACHLVGDRDHKEVESTETCKKRASVAIIIAFHIPSPNESPSSSWINVDAEASKSAAEDDVPGVATLEELEDQEWVKKAIPHILFIKRAAREGDRWASHVALPGGMRENNETDSEAAIRETVEEVGIKLTDKNSIYAGGLDQRMVTTSFGSRELLVLAPYVWVWTKPGLPVPIPQESEVHSAHWVSIASLLDSKNRTHETVDIASRMSQNYMNGFIPVAIVKFFTGSMLFSAISMIATQSVLASSSKSPSLSGKSQSEGESQSISVGQEDLSDLSGPSSPSRETTESPKLIMWGLTLAVMTDFLDLLPPHDAISLWTYPTFAAPDLALILGWLNQPNSRRTERQQRIRPMKVPKNERAAQRAERRAARKLKRTQRAEENAADYAHSIVEAIGETGEMDYVGTAMLDFYAKIKPAIGITIGVRFGVLGIGLLVARRLYRRYTN